MEGVNTDRDVTYCDHGRTLSIHSCLDSCYGHISSLLHFCLRLFLKADYVQMNLTSSDPVVLAPLTELTSNGFQSQSPRQQNQNPSVLS